MSSLRVQKSSFSAINCGGKRHLKGYTSQVLETELTESTTNNCFLLEDAGNQSTTEMIFCGVVDLTTATVAFPISGLQSKMATIPTFNDFSNAL